MHLVIKPLQCILYYYLKNPRLSSGAESRGCVYLVTGGGIFQNDSKGNFCSQKSGFIPPQLVTIGSLNSILIGSLDFSNIIRLVVLVE